MSSQGIPIHSPKGTLLFIRGVKERIKDPKGEDSVLKEFVRIRNEIRQSHPQLTLFHSSDSFELRHEIGIHSKIFPSWNWKTCHNCLQKLAKGEHRNSQEAIQDRFKSTSKIFCTDFPKDPTKRKMQYVAGYLT